MHLRKCWRVGQSTVSRSHAASKSPSPDRLECLSRQQGKRRESVEQNPAMLVENRDLHCSKI